MTSASSSSYLTTSHLRSLFALRSTAQTSGPDVSPTADPSAPADIEPAVTDRLNAEADNAGITGSPSYDFWRQQHTRLMTMQGVRWTAAIADQGVVSLGRFLMGVLVARTCTKEAYGLYALGMTFVLLATDLQAALITTPLTNFAPRIPRERSRGYRGSTLVHQVTFSVSSAGIVAFVALFLSQRGNHSAFVPILSAIALALPFLTLREYVRKLLMLMLRPIQLLFFDGAVTLFQFVPMLWLLLLRSVSPARAYIALGASSALAVLLWLHANRSLFAFTRSTVRSDFTDNLAVGKWVLASGSTWTLSNSFLPWCLAAMLGAEATAIWSACFTTAALASPLIMGTSNYIAPRIAHSFGSHDTAELQAARRRCTLVAAGVAALTTALLVAAGPILLHTTFGPSFSSHTHIVWLIAAVSGMVAIGFPSSLSLFALGRAHFDFAINLATLLLLLPASLVAIRLGGVIGAALGLLACTTLATVARWTATSFALRSATSQSLSLSGG